MTKIYLLFITPIIFFILGIINNGYNGFVGFIFWCWFIIGVGIIIYFGTKKEWKKFTLFLIGHISSFLASIIYAMSNVSLM